MKTLLLTIFALLVFVLPSIAQVDHDYNPKDVIPEAGMALKKSEVPQSVLMSANNDFALDNPQSWTKFPYALKEYGWVYDKDASDVKPDRYEVVMKTKNGDDLSAVYSKDGNLIATKEEYLNGTIPASVMEALANSKYKDWKIVGSKEIIRYYHDKKSVEQHFRLTVEKDNVKRSISFNYQANANSTSGK